MALPAADEIDDLNSVAFANDCFGEGLPLQDGQVVLHGDTARIDRQPREQITDGEWLVDFEGLAVQRDDQRVESTAANLSESRLTP